MASGCGAPGAADGRQRLRQPAGHGVDLVVRHRQPPGVGLERGVAHAHVGHEVEEAGVVVGVDADGGDGELGLEQAGEHGRSQTSGTDHAEAIRVDGQAYDLSGCGPPGGGGTAPAVGLCSTGGVPVACRGSAPGQDERRASRARGQSDGRLGARARGLPSRPGGTLRPCRSTNSAATSAEPPSRSWSATARSPSARRVTPATSAGCCPRSPSTHRRPTSAARERPRAAPPAPAPPVPPATDDVIAALDALREEVECCSSCVLAETRTRAVFGEGDPGADLMFVGEAPGYHEDQQGRPFVGQAGKLLEQLLASIGMTREQVYIANVLKSRPPNNRDPRPEEIDACRPYLWRQIEIIRPKVICTLGNFATKLLTGDQRGITKVHGQPRATEIAGHRLYLYPIFHPAAALYTPANAGDAQGGLPAAARAAGARRAAARGRGGRAAGRGAAGLAAARAPARAGGRRRARRPRRRTLEDAAAAAAADARATPRRRGRRRRRRGRRPPRPRPRPTRPAPPDRGARARRRSRPPPVGRPGRAPETGPAPARRARLPRPARPPNRSSSASSR